MVLMAVIVMADIFKCGGMNRYDARVARYLEAIRINEAESEGTDKNEVGCEDMSVFEEQLDENQVWKD